MGFSYPDTIAVSIATDSAEVPISAITPDVAGLGAYLGCQIFKFGQNTGVTMAMKAYDNSLTLVSTSEIVDISALPTATDYFYGWVYFEFSPRIPMSTSTATTFTLLLNNYNFSATDWLGVVRDWPTTMGYGTNSQIFQSPYALDLISAT